MCTLPRCASDVDLHASKATARQAATGQATGGLHARHVVKAHGSGPRPAQPPDPRLSGVLGWKAMSPGYRNSTVPGLVDLQFEVPVVEDPRLRVADDIAQRQLAGRWHVN